MKRATLTKEELEKTIREAEEKKAHDALVIKFTARFQKLLREADKNGLTFDSYNYTKRPFW